MKDTTHMADFARCCVAVPGLTVRVVPAGDKFEAYLSRPVAWGTAMAMGEGDTADEAVGEALRAAEDEGWELPEP